MASDPERVSGDALTFGKPNDDVFDAAFRHLGIASRDLLVPPAKGFDNGVLRLGNHRVLVFTADPISHIPSLGVRRSAWLSIHHLASDLATSGVRPRYAVVDYNLPGDFDDRTLIEYLKGFGDECQELGISIVGGHTGRYPGCGLTVIGAGVLFAESGDFEFVTPAMASKGDTVIMTKGPAIEATAVLAHSFPSKIKEALGSVLLKRAKGRISQCSTFLDSTVAASVGLRLDGVTSMHDCTEGGVVMALSEMAAAAGKEIAVDLRLIPVPEDVGRVCDLFGLSPFETLSEGTLIITCRPTKARKVLGALRRRGIECFEVGEVREGSLRTLKANRGAKLISRRLRSDRYWDVYARGIEEGWR